MKLFYTVIFFSLLASAAFAREESILARVTSYWAGEGSKFASTGRRLHSGHCAVDPKRIPYGSKVVFPDRACTAVDTGPAVISRKAARLCGRTASQLKAIVVDRFFETKREAMAWTNTHPHFMTLQIVRPGSRLRTARAMINEKYSESLLPRRQGLTAEIADRHWTSTETAVHEGPMKLIDAPIRAARWGGRAA
jgi:Uncharacterized protein conserved in bacteria